jgi:hypothetical protein
MYVGNLRRDCTNFKKQKETNGSTYKFPIRTVGHGNACDCYLDHLLDTLIAKGVIPCMHEKQLSDKVTNAQDDFMFLEDVVSLLEFNNKRNFVTP